MNRKDIPIIKSLEIKRLHGIYDYKISFNNDVTIIYGENGSGKTTLLHILSNIIEGDLDRFFFLDFSYIELITHEYITSLTKKSEEEIEVKFGATSTIIRKTLDENSSIHLKNEILTYFSSPPIYLPAFRVILEAASRNSINSEGEFSRSQIEKLRRNEIDRFRIQELHEDSRAVLREAGFEWGGDTFQRNAVKTVLCRNWFGQFVPFIRMPSLTEISESLYDDFRQAQLSVSRLDRSSVMDFVESTVEILADDDNRVFTTQQILDIEKRINEKMNRAESFSHESSQIYMRIDPIMQTLRSKNAHTNESKIGTMLKTYEDLLDRQLKLQEDEFKDLNVFQNSVNIFLKNKTVEVMNIENEARRRVKKFVKIGKRMFGFDVLSSGERHILTLLYSVSSINESNGLLLIDEPEISMHVAWQRQFAVHLKYNGGIRQTIVCTHSPEIAAEFKGKLTKFHPRNSI